MERELHFKLDRVEFAYAKKQEKILQAIDLEIHAGEWVALLGSNGSGKSTLLKILSALLSPTQGSCFICGKDSREAKSGELRGASGIVFQNPEDQIVAAIVEEDTAFGPENLGCPTEEVALRVEESLRAVGLWERRKDMVSSLSGGQKQRLALAGVLAMRPRAILLDEALSMLDPRSRLDFTEIIAREHKNGATIVEVTHRLEEIRRAERVVALKQGRIICDMPSCEFLNKSEEELATMGLVKPPLERFCEALKKEGFFAPAFQPSGETLAREIEEELCRLL